MIEMHMEGHGDTVLTRMIGTSYRNKETGQIVVVREIRIKTVGGGDYTGTFFLDNWEEVAHDER